jgi:3-hydroxyacyl-[acyl-carrier-protein] dehydratase
MEAMARLPFVLDAAAACLDGHFPGRPVIPGVVLLDAAIHAFGLHAPLRIEQAKFLKPCLPGMGLELVMAPRDGGADLRIEHGIELMASARIRFHPRDGSAS